LITIRSRIIVPDSLPFTRLTALPIYSPPTVSSKIFNSSKNIRTPTGIARPTRVPARGELPDAERRPPNRRRSTRRSARANFRTLGPAYRPLKRCPAGAITPRRTAPKGRDNPKAVIRARTPSPAEASLPTRNRSRRAPGPRLYSENALRARLDRISQKPGNAPRERDEPPQPPTYEPRRRS
jgi:hypothetical protein